MQTGIVSLSDVKGAYELERCLVQNTHRGYLFEGRIDYSGISLRSSPDLELSVGQATQQPLSSSDSLVCVAIRPTRGEIAGVYADGLSSLVCATPECAIVRITTAGFGGGETSAMIAIYYRPNTHAMA